MVSKAGGKRQEHTFYLMMAAFMAAIVFAGFARTFFLRPWFREFAAEHSPSEPIFYVHGVLFAAWMVILVVQPALVSTRNFRQHRALGYVGAALAGSMVAIGTAASIVAARRPTGFIGVSSPALEFLAVPLFDMALFGVLIALAVKWRRDAQSHKRLMLLATVNLLEAAIIRIPLPAAFVAIGGQWANFWLSDIFILALAAWDFYSQRRLHPVTLWAGSLIILSQPLRVWFSGTEAWHIFAEWAVGF